MALIRPHRAEGVESEAVFSDCEGCRCSLTRVWDAALPRLAWVMLNPSTADKRRNDPTIARCEARTMGGGAYRIVNLCAFRATYPKDLRTAADPAGETRRLGHGASSAAGGCTPRRTAPGRRWRCFAGRAPSPCIPA